MKCITLESLQVSRAIFQLLNSSRSCERAQGLEKLEGTAAVFENSKGKLETWFYQSLAVFLSQAVDATNLFLLFKQMLFAWQAAEF